MGGSPVSVYLNGQFLAEEQALIPIDDRGFLFADGVYEVVHVYNGRPFEWDRHMARLNRSLTAVEMAAVDASELAEIRDRLIRENAARESALYIQITRGVQRRQHTPPSPGTVRPTVLLWARAVDPFDREFVEQGISVITVPDDRWGKVWIKTIGLLPNVLAKGKAHALGVYDAVFVRDGMVTEATSANIFRVANGIVQTAPVTNYILPGVTRAVVLEIAREAGLPVLEEPFAVEDLYRSDELFLTGTTTEVLPIGIVDGRPIGSGSAGPVALDLLQRFKERIAAVSKGG